MSDFVIVSNQKTTEKKRKESINLALTDFNVQQQQQQQE